MRWKTRASSRLGRPFKLSVEATEIDRWRFLDPAFTAIETFHTAHNDDAGEQLHRPKHGYQCKHVDFHGSTLEHVRSDIFGIQQSGDPKESIDDANDLLNQLGIFVEALRIDRLWEVTLRCVLMTWLAMGVAVAGGRFCHGDYSTAHLIGCCKTRFQMRGT